MHAIHIPSERYTDAAIMIPCQCFCLAIACGLNASAVTVLHKAAQHPEPQNSMFEASSALSILKTQNSILHEVPYLGAPEPYFFGSGVAGAGGDIHGRWDFLIGPDYTSPSFLTSETLSVVIDGRTYALEPEMHRAHHSGVFFGTESVGQCKVLVADFSIEGEPSVTRLVRVQNLSPNKEARVSIRADVAPAKDKGISSEAVSGKAVRITADKTAFCFGSEVKNWANRISTIAFSTPSTVGVSTTGYELATAETTLPARGSVSTGLYHFQTYGSANVRRTEHDCDQSALQDSAPRTKHSKAGKAPNPEQDLQASLSEWRRWLATGKHLDKVIDYPKARAIVEGSLVAVRVQQDRDGGFIAGARKYANSYVRDSHGGVRLLLATGHYAEAKRVIETIHHRWSVAGFIPNYWSMGSDFFIGRSFVNGSSEIPAYYALMIRDYLAATHDRRFVEGIKGSLKFAVDTQLDFMAKHGWRIDFNGDETEQYCDTKDGQEYGGFPAFKEWSPKSWSFASSALACASTQFYIDWLRSKGPSTQAESYEAKLKKVKDAIDATFLRTGGAPSSCAPAEERGLGERFRDSAGRQDPTSNGLRFTRRPVRSKNSHNSPGARERIVSPARLSLANHNTHPPVGKVGELVERSEIPDEFRLRTEIGANRGRGLAGRPTSEYFHSHSSGGLSGDSERTAREARLKPFHHWIRYQDRSWPTSTVPNYDLMPLWVGAHLNGDAQNQDAQAMASYRDPNSGFLPTAPPFVNGFCGHNLGYLLYDLTTLGDPRAAEIFRTMMSSSLYGCWGTVSEFYGPNGTPNGHNFRVFESGIDAEAIVKYFESQKPGYSCFR